MELDDPKLEMEVRMGIEAANVMGKRIVFPEARKFVDLFDEFTIVEAVNRPLRPWYKSHYVCSWSLEGDAECHLDSSCWVSGKVRVQLDVTPSEEVMDAIQENMLMSKDYVYNFEIIVREGGTALVNCKYDRILGDRWFAIIDAKTIPGYTEALAQEEADTEMVEDLESSGAPTLDLFGMKM